MNRSGLVVVGMAVAIIGWAVLFSGLTTLNPKLSPTGEPIGILASLIPGSSDAKPAAATRATPGGGGAEEARGVANGPPPLRRTGARGAY